MDTCQELSAAAHAGNADQSELAAAIHPADMLEAQKLKSLRPHPGPCPIDSSKPAKLQNPSLLLGQIQVESDKPLPKLPEKFFRLVPVLETAHEIIDESHQIRLALTLRLEFLLKPQVQRVMQIKITENTIFGWSHTGAPRFLENPSRTFAPL